MKLFKNTLHGMFRLVKLIKESFDKLPKVNVDFILVLGIGTSKIGDS